MPDFSKTSTPFKVPATQQDRNIVAEQTQPFGGDGRNKANAGPLHDNPSHHYASELEDRKGDSGQYGPGKDVICTPGPSRQTPNHAPSRTGGFHAHMGTSGRAHKFPGRRV